MSYNIFVFEFLVVLNNFFNFINLNNWQVYYWCKEMVSIDDQVGDVKLDYCWNMDQDVCGLGVGVGVDY